MAICLSSLHLLLLLPAGLPPRMMSNTRYPPYSTVPSMDPLIRILDFSVARIALVMQPPRRYCPAVVTLGSVTPSGSSGYPDHDLLPNRSSSTSFHFWTPVSSSEVTHRNCCQIAPSQERPLNPWLAVLGVLDGGLTCPASFQIVYMYTVLPPLRE
jgi:hypothetical protein